MGVSSRGGHASGGSGSSLGLFPRHGRGAFQQPRPLAQAGGLHRPILGLFHMNPSTCGGRANPIPSGVATLNVVGRLVIPGPQGRPGNVNAYPSDKMWLRKKDFLKIVEWLEIPDIFL